MRGEGLRLGLKGQMKHESRSEYGCLSHARPPSRLVVVIGSVQFFYLWSPAPSTYSCRNNTTLVVYGDDLGATTTVQHYSSD